MFSCILYHYSKLLHKKLSQAQRILTWLLRDMVVNRMFPKYSILLDWLINCRFGKSCREWRWSGAKGKTKIKNKHTNLAPAVQQAKQNLCNSVRYVAHLAGFYGDVVECLLHMRRVVGSILSRDKRWLDFFHLLHLALNVNNPMRWAWWPGIEWLLKLRFGDESKTGGGMCNSIR